jgi:hypothetical protein
MEKLFTVLVVAAIATIFQAWVFMLALGGLHSVFAVVPALSFGKSLIVSVCLSVLASPFRGGSK